MNSDITITSNINNASVTFNIKSDTTIITATKDGTPESFTTYGKWFSNDIFVSNFYAPIVIIFKFNGANSGTMYFVRTLNLFTVTMDDITNAIKNSGSDTKTDFTFTGTK